MRAVLDTNVVVSAMLFEHGRLAWLREAWCHGRFTPLLDRPCADELLRVLAYPKFRLGADDIKALLATYLPYTATVGEPHRATRKLPRCRDPHDQKFLALAEAGRADVLVSGDKSLLALSGHTQFAIESPDAFRARLKL